MQLGTFGISANDPQFNHWFSGPSSICGGSSINPATTTADGVSPAMGTVNVTGNTTPPSAVTIPPTVQ
jgi:hypothetical protein